MIEETAVKILSMGYVCDHCLGRQFAKLNSQPNEEKGKTIRNLISFENNTGKVKVDQSNFSRRKGKCVICENTFDSMPKISKKIVKMLKPMDFEKFLVGVKMSDSLVMNEESLFEKIGIKYSEPIKSEISREIGRLITESLGKQIDQNKPDVLIIFDIQNKNIEIFSNPLFVYGEYKKLVRGLPQTSSPRYKKTVQDIIAKPLVRATSSNANLLHAMGREDKEARCIVWRPFIIELKQPVKRKMNLQTIRKQINKMKSVRVRNLRISNKDEVSHLKSKRPYKVYRVLVNFEKKVETPERVKGIVGIVKQRTPERILSSKTDKTKNKKVKTIKWKRINNKRYQFEIKAESGLYLKELVSGDSGRTRPSISGILGNNGEIKEFDLVGLEER